jgi:hypothetical protein
MTDVPSSTRDVAALVADIQAVLTPDLVHRDYEDAPGSLREKCCYPMSEAYFHLAGGKAAGLQPKVLVWFDDFDNRCSHWWLEQRGRTIDLTNVGGMPFPDFDYVDGVKKGFMNPSPSARARKIMGRVNTRRQAT